jgi:polar amino acid transport system permease protein
LPGRIASIYGNIFRGTPLMIQLFAFTVACRSLGVTFPQWIAALLTLGLNSGAYQAEYFAARCSRLGAGR